MTLSTNKANMNFTTNPVRRVQRVRHELKRRDVRVLSVETLGANFASITFADDSLADFVSASFDDHIKFIFNSPQGELVKRDYTPRSFNLAARTLTIEFALHGHGAASDWARAAQPGDTAMIGGPRGSMIVPTDYAWHLLAGDDSALPAINRRLEELPADAHAIVLVQAADAADRRSMASAAKVQLQWVANADDMLAAVRALQLPPGEGYAWCAGEASEMARLRDVLVNEKQHPREAMRVAAYWKRRASDFHEDLAV